MGELKAIVGALRRWWSTSVARGIADMVAKLMERTEVDRPATGLPAVATPDDRRAFVLEAIQDTVLARELRFSGDLGHLSVLVSERRVVATKSVDLPGLTHDQVRALNSPDLQARADALLGAIDLLSSATGRLVLDVHMTPGRPLGRLGVRLARPQADGLDPPQDAAKPEAVPGARTDTDGGEQPPVPAAPPSTGQAHMPVAPSARVRALVDDVLSRSQPALLMDGSGARLVDPEAAVAVASAPHHQSDVTKWAMQVDGHLGPTLLVVANPANGGDAVALAWEAGTLGAAEIPPREIGRIHSLWLRLGRVETTE